LGGAHAYFVQGAIAGVAPTWSWSPSSPQSAVVMTSYIGSFGVVAAPAPLIPIRRRVTRWMDRPIIVRR
jgi:hypothetical protein